MAQSEYSYYSDDEHHDGDRNRQKSGMTERNVVPDSLPDQINNMEDVNAGLPASPSKIVINEADNDAESDWSDQVREANEKSGFNTKKQKTNKQKEEQAYLRKVSEGTELAQVKDSDQSPFFSEPGAAKTVIQVRRHNESGEKQQPVVQQAPQIQTIHFDQNKKEEEESKKVEMIGLVPLDPTVSKLLATRMNTSSAKKQKTL